MGVLCPPIVLQMSTLSFPSRDSRILAQEGGEDVVAEFISYVVSAMSVYGRGEVMRMLRKIARPNCRLLPSFWL